MLYDLVFEGGGARGVVFLGALAELQKAGHRHGRLIGCSAGAIVATLLAAGYTPDEMIAALNERIEGKPVFLTFLAAPAPFSRQEIEQSAIRALFRDIDWPLLPDALQNTLDEALIDALLRFPVHRNVMAYLERGGWFSADPFLAWLGDKLSTGTFRGRRRAYADMTLRQFYQATDAELSMIVTDTTAARMRVLNHRTAPNCPLVWAVRMSMNLPFVWPDVQWLPSWGLYLGGALAGHVMVDGGLLSSFPLELLVSTEPYVQAWMGKPSGNSVAGLLIDEWLRVPNDPHGDASLPVAGGLDLASLKAVERISRMVNTMTSARDTMVMEVFEELVVRLPAKGYGTLEFDMNDARRDRLIEGGRQAMRRWLAKTPPPQADNFAHPQGMAAINARAMQPFLDP